MVKVRLRTEATYAQNSLTDMSISIRWPTPWHFEHAWGAGRVLHARHKEAIEWSTKDSKQPSVIGVLGLHVCTQVSSHSRGLIIFLQRWFTTTWLPSATPASSFLPARQHARAKCAPQHRYYS